MVKLSRPPEQKARKRWRLMTGNTWVNLFSVFLLMLNLYVDAWATICWYWVFTSFVTLIFLYDGMSCKNHTEYDIFTSNLELFDIWKWISVGFWGQSDSTFLVIMTGENMITWSFWSLEEFWYQHNSKIMISHYMLLWNLMKIGIESHTHTHSYIVTSGQVRLFIINVVIIIFILTGSHHICTLDYSWSES